MVFRRRWRLSVLLAATLTPSLALAAGLPASASDMEAAHGSAAVDLRHKVIDAAPTNKLLRDQYGEAVCKALANEKDPKGPNELNSTNPDARLNTAIMVYELNTIATDKTLMGMLKNPDPSVRYWGARGLAQIAPDLKVVGDQPAIAALKAAGAVETSGVVIEEIIKALIIYDDFPALTVVLDAVSSHLSKGIPDTRMLVAAANGLDAISGKVASATSADKAHVAEIAVKLASFTSQQLAANKAAHDAIGTTVPKDYLDASNALIEAAAKVAGNAAGKTYSWKKTTDTDEFQLDVNTLFGTPPNKPVQIQTDLPGVKPPPAIKPGT